MEDVIGLIENEEQGQQLNEIEIEVINAIKNYITEAYDESTTKTTILEKETVICNAILKSYTEESLIYKTLNKALRENDWEKIN